MKEWWYVLATRGVDAGGEGEKIEARRKYGGGDDRGDNASNRGGGV